MNPDKLKRWIKSSVLETSAYHVQDADRMIKLDAMENPYQWPEDLKQLWLEVLRNVEINRYPGADAVALKQKLKQVFSIPEDHQILLGNGSDEIIQTIALSLTENNPIFLAPEPSFVMYEVIAKMTGVRYAGISLREDFSLDLESMLEAIDELQPAVIFLACPNNPTGNLFDDNAVKEILMHAPGLVIIDEAYHAFSEYSYMASLPNFDNLMIMRTLSKIGLAGLRLGFLAGPAAWIDEINKVRLPYNINVLTEKSTEFVLDHIDMINIQAADIRRDRELLFAEMNRIPGIKIFPSKTNFLLFRIESGENDRVFRELKNSGILIKNLGNNHPLVNACLRVTVGTAAENKKFLHTLGQIMLSNKL